MCIASLPHRQFETFPDLQVDANASQRQGGPITLKRCSLPMVMH